MAMTRSTVIGVFDERAMAENALEALNNAGFSDDQIRYSGRVDAGTRTGGFWAGLKNLFTGDDTTTTGGSARGMLDDLTDFGVPQDQAQYYANEYQNGRSIVAVRAPGREQEAMDILRSNGAYDYGTRSGMTGAASTGYTTSNQAAGYTTSNADVDQVTTDRTTGYTQTTDYDRTADYAPGDERRSMKLREEQLQANKRAVQSGEVQLHKEVITEQQNIDVPVTHEEVYVERRPATGDQVDDTPIGEGETIRVPVSEEQVQLSKNQVVTGEVEIGKRAVQETQRVSDTVRREEARVDTSGNPRLQGNNPDLVDRDVDTTDRVTRRTDVDTDPNNPL